MTIKYPHIDPATVPIRKRNGVESVSCEEVIKWQSAPASRISKSGIRPDIERTKSRLLTTLDVGKEERDNWKRGWCVRSGYEANYARSILWEREHGKIIKAMFEPYRFQFPDDTTATSFYIPDFVTQYEGQKELIVEVKGYFKKNDPGRSKLNKFFKHNRDLLQRFRFVCPLRYSKKRKQATPYEWIIRKSWFDPMKSHINYKYLNNGLITWE